MVFFFFLSFFHAFFHSSFIHLSFIASFLSIFFFLSSIIVTLFNIKIANKTSVPTTPKRKKGLPSEKGLPSPTPSQRKFGSVFDVYKDADFAEVAEYVLEATIYNLMNEVLHGEFSLEEPPAVVFHSSSNDVQVFIIYCFKFLKKYTSLTLFFFFN